MSFFKNIGAVIPLLTVGDNGSQWDGKEWIIPTEEIHVFSSRDSSGWKSSAAVYIRYTTVHDLLRHKPVAGIIVFVDEIDCVVMGMDDKWVLFSSINKK